MTPNKCLHGRIKDQHPENPRLIGQVLRCPEFHDREAYDSHGSTESKTLIGRIKWKIHERIVDRREFISLRLSLRKEETLLKSVTQNTTKERRTPFSLSPVTVREGEHLLFGDQPDRH